MRIVQACRKLGLEFVCVHTAEDIHSGHVRIAKELGGEKSLYQVSSYHDANEILSVADDAGATAIHPGYGFFAEDFRFARRVTTRERKLIDRALSSATSRRMMGASEDRSLMLPP